MARKRSRVRGKDEEGTEGFTPVESAPVIRLHFTEPHEQPFMPEEEPRPLTATTTAYRPVHKFDIHQIEAALDSLQEFKEEEEETPIEEAERQVDRLIRGVPTKRETVVKEKVTEYVPKKKATKKTPKKAPRKAAAVKQDRCAAETKAGKRCKNASRQGSDYCASHKGYRAPAVPKKAAVKKPVKKAPAKKKPTKTSAKKPTATAVKASAAKKAAKKPAPKAPAKKKPVAKKAPAKKVPAKKETLAQTAPKRPPAKKAPAKKKPAAKKAPAVPKAVPAAAKKPAGKAYEPQCGAVTKDGVQCRNSARHGSKYCGSHKGYRPITAEAALARVDSKPRAKKAKDTLPTQGKAASAKEHPQCGAITAGGKQCKNSARTGSKYCGSHKGYNPRAAVARMDTQPRWKKAEDTKPALK